MVYHSVAEIYTEIEGVRTLLYQRVGGLNPGQAGFKPSADRWSVAEILEHLAKVDRLLVSRIGKFVDEAEPRDQGHPSFFPFSIESIVESARDQKFKSPEPALPDAGLPIHESLGKLQSSRADLLSMQPRIESRHLSQTTFPHFVFGQLNIYQWLAFIGLHENRHLRQIESVVIGLEFPGS